MKIDLTKKELDTLCWVLVEYHVDVCPILQRYIKDKNPRAKTLKEKLSYVESLQIKLEKLR